MSVSLTSCPNCNTMLLSDTVQCPNCRHILGRGALVETGPDEMRSNVVSAGDEDPCPSCGEMVRRGLVRCWNCSTFMRDDIATSYRGMQQSPTPVIYSRLPDDENVGTDRTYQFEESTDGSFAEGWIDDDLINLPDISDEDLLLVPLTGLESEENDFETAPGFEPQVDENAVTETTSTVVTSDADDMSSNGDGTASWITGDPMTPTAPAVSSDSAADTSAASSAPVGSDDSSASSGGEVGVPHSVATAGDVLLRAALEQEAEATRLRKKSGRRAAPGRLLVYCPNGHQVEVSERHRGRTGHCPKCKSPFFVPTEDWKPQAPTDGSGGASTDGTGEGGTSDGAAPDATGRELRWMEDVHLHKVDPSKLKLKPGSLTGEFQPIDLGFSSDTLLMVSLAAGKGGLFGGKKKSLDEVRGTVRTELGQDKPPTELSAAWSGVIVADALADIVIIQPAQDDYTSMFAGIPVFGENRIAVRIPRTEGESLLRFLSFELSTFRQFAQNLSEVHHIVLPCEEFGIPLTDSFVEKTCHYSEQTLAVLQNVEFYQADPNFDVKLMGRECQGCGLAISEDSRKKEKIGGSSGKGIAKAKCPKCGRPMGNLSLFTIDVAKETGTKASDDGEEATYDVDNDASEESAT